MTTTATTAAAAAATTATANANAPSPSSPFQLPPLYFQNKGQSLALAASHADAQATAAALLLPPEVLHQCLTAYASYGDLCKLACTQAAWKNVLYDAAAASGPSSEYKLACALLHGDASAGLRRNTPQALSLLQKLALQQHPLGDGVNVNHAMNDVVAVVAIDPRTQGPIYNVTAFAANENDDVPAVAVISTGADSTISHAVANGNSNMIRTAHNGECEQYAAKAMKKLAYFYLENQQQQQTGPSSAHASTCEPEPNSNDTFYYCAAAATATAETGLAWLKCAFEAGRDVESAHDLAVIYEYGRYSVPTDVVAAADYFTKAATAGHVEAMAELALCYELGCGVEANDETALDWYIKAATAGHVTAKYSVGEAFEEARGVPQSDEEACLWYYKAAVEGDEDSRKALRRLEAIARIVVPGARALLDA